MCSPEATVAGEVALTRARTVRAEDDRLSVPVRDCGVREGDLDPAPRLVPQLRCAVLALQGDLPSRGL